MERADEAALDSAVLDLSGETAGEEVRDDTSPFFVSKKAAAVLKHAILDKYVVPFASKVGKYAPDGRVVYLDGYAGPGRYDDGTPGSPALILESAAAIADFRKLDCYFIEKNRKNFQSLSQLVAEAREQGLDAHALQGRVERHLDHVLEAAQGAPLFAFLDPFGLGITFEALTERIFGSRRASRQPTEVLLNFNANAVRRIGGLLTSWKSTPGKPATLRALDVACGGDWWREEFVNSADNAEAVGRITRGFARRVGRAVGAGSWTVGVRNRANLQVAYNLVHFSRHRDGLWLFGEAASLAQVEWRRACLPPETPGMLFNAGDTFEQEEEARRLGWIKRIRANLEDLLHKHGSIVVGDYQAEVLAGVLGEAREKHVRAAIKELFREGKTTCNGVGNVRDLLVTVAY
ncbi:three-Cys-motif partner protein TcmP [Streptomyces microflavus]|uniref:three-Cys-motif partner protein TcmP n=1 Tax=Streptomyces microflavus TaxID=1919 RepID=UPI0015C64F5A|nr:three-Cys-motif partner protein TcmP [Streptomyces microflavus]WSA58948.1 three-Cys-motif partner protein TcmP [Streptomyces microflavus]WTF67483.1 three-Cys-motif partner protein TcmP [Streptomyces microflavus]